MSSPVRTGGDTFAQNDSGEASVMVGTCSWAARMSPRSRIGGAVGDALRAARVLHVNHVARWPGQRWTYCLPVSPNVTTRIREAVRSPCRGRSGKRICCCEGLVGEADNLAHRDAASQGTSAGGLQVGCGWAEEPLG